MVHPKKKTLGTFTRPEALLRFIVATTTAWQASKDAIGLLYTTYNYLHTYALADWFSCRYMLCTGVDENPSYLGGRKRPDAMAEQ